MLILLLVVLVTEVLVLHALISDALRAGNAALDILRELSQTASTIGGPARAT